MKQKQEKIGSFLNMDIEDKGKSNTHSKKEELKKEDKQQRTGQDIRYVHMQVLDSIQQGKTIMEE